MSDETPARTADETAAESGDETAAESAPDATAPDDGPPASWSPPDATGVGAVDEAVDALRVLDTLPTTEHIEHYETVHRRLQDALADLGGA